MSIKSSMIFSIGAVAGAAMLGLSSAPASAMALVGPSLEPAVASAQIDKVWYYRYGYRGYGWRGYGWRGGYYRHCWRGYYGRLVCN